MIILQDRISERQNEDAITQLRIISNPHMEQDAQKEFINQLMARRRRFRGIVEDKLDRAALERLRSQLKKESKAVKVK